MSKDRSRLLALIACVIIGRAAAASPSIRGVDPEIASRYSFQLGAFACLSGDKTVPADRVNDNYCDCADGSDEPGNGPLPLANLHGSRLYGRKASGQSPARAHADVLVAQCRHVSVP